MAINFYELGKQTGAKTPKGQQGGFEALVGGITNTVDEMIATSQIKTAALQAAMPQGVAIEKVPEELRGKATEFLTANKKAYTDASKVLASGINPSSARYKKAVETINGVNSKFENLSTSLEAVALKRQAALDDPNGYSPSTGKEDRLTWGNLSNGDLYSGMTFNDDGTVNYTNSQGESKSFADFNVTPQSFEGQNTFLALNDKFTNAKYSGKTDQWSMHSGEAEATVNALFQKLKPAGQKDMMMADIDYLEKTTGFQSGTDEYDNAINGVLENPNDAIAGYKQHMLGTLEANYNSQKGPKVKDNVDGPTGNTGKYGGYGYPPTSTGGDPITGQPAFTNIGFNDKITRRSALLNLDEVAGEHFTYRYSEKDGWQAFNLEDDSFARDMKGSDVARIEGLYNRNDSKAERSMSYFDAKRSKARTEALPPKGSKGISVKALKVKNAKDFQKAILNIFNKDVLDDYAFEDVTRVTEFGADKVSGQVRVKSKDGSFNKIFNIGNKANDELAVELNNLFSSYYKGGDIEDKSYEDPEE